MELKDIFSSLDDHELEKGSGSGDLPCDHDDLKDVLKDAREAFSGSDTTDDLVDSDALHINTQQFESMEAYQCYTLCSLIFDSYCKFLNKLSHILQERLDNAEQAFFGWEARVNRANNAAAECRDILSATGLHRVWNKLIKRWHQVQKDLEEIEGYIDSYRLEKARALHELETLRGLLSPEELLKKSYTWRKRFYQVDGGHIHLDEVRLYFYEILRECKDSPLQTDFSNFLTKQLDSLRAVQAFFEQDQGEHDDQAA